MWCRSYVQASAVTESQASNLSYSLAQSWQRVVTKTQIMTLGVLLGLGGGFWLTTEASAPQAAQAKSIRVNLSVNRQANESYETLVKRAKAVAWATTQRRFYQSSKVTNVTVIIVGQNQGAVAPVLSLRVSRPQWSSHRTVCSKKKPSLPCLTNPYYWVKYFTDAQLLLGFRNVAAAIPSEPETASPVTPSQTSEPDINDDQLQSPDAIVPVEVPSNSQEPTILPDNISPSPSTSSPTQPSGE